MALQSGRGVPFEYIEMKLLEKFGWTPEQLYSQPAHKIDFYINALNIEGQFQQREINKAKRRASNGR